MPIFITLVIGFLTVSVNCNMRTLRGEEHLDTLVNVMFVLNAAIFQSVAVDVASLQFQYPVFFWLAWASTAFVGVVLLFFVVKEMAPKVFRPSLH